MIPQKILALFEFIDFLDKNKNEYIEKYIPLCNELKKLDSQRNSLNPKKNYKDKQVYDKIQIEIKEKFTPITENIYNPITRKLLELKIWSGEIDFTSIWNNNISEIYDFKSNFTNEDTKEVFQYKQKYLNFRTETNSDFLSLSFVFHELDKVLKELFIFFKDVEENEFESFEAKLIKINDYKEIAQSMRENQGKNVTYAINTQTIFDQKQVASSNKIAEIKQEIIMGDKIQVGNISNNKGHISVGKKNKTKVNSEDEFAKKSFHWQKWGIIIGTIIAIVTIIVTVIYSK